jgi:hypothetical protein
LVLLPYSKVFSTLSSLPRISNSGVGRTVSRYFFDSSRLAKQKKSIAKLDQLHLFFIPIGRRDLHPLSFQVGQKAGVFIDSRFLKNVFRLWFPRAIT